MANGRNRQLYYQSFHHLEKHRCYQLERKTQSQKVDSIQNLIVDGKAKVGHFLAYSSFDWICFNSSKAA